MELVKLTYEISTNLPASEKYVLADQMRRSAISIPSNIAEGQKRSGPKGMMQFCSIALGSVAELETQLLLAEQLFKVSTEPVRIACEDVAKMLTGLNKALRSKI